MVSGQRAVALQALQRYDVTPQRVRLAAESYNSIFRVTTAEAVYALRVEPALRIHPESTAGVEAAWHQRLRRHGVHVPDVVANADGEFATFVREKPGEPASRVCLLLEWVAGRPLRSGLTERRAAALGRLSARLQQDGTAWSPPGAGEILRADRVLYWRLPDRLADAGSRFGFGTLFTDARDRAQSVVAALWQDPPHPPHLVHGDLTPANVIMSARHGLVPVDFQDLVWGLDVQDLSFTVAALSRWPDGDRLVDAFRGGYGECRSWPEVSPALFGSLIVARALQQVNLTLSRSNHTELEGYVVRHAERIRAWMRRPSL